MASGFSVAVSQAAARIGIQVTLLYIAVSIRIGLPGRESRRQRPVRLKLANAPTHEAWRTAGAAIDIDALLEVRNPPDMGGPEHGWRRQPSTLFRGACS